MTGIGFEYSRVFLPSVNNGSVGRSPSQCFEVLGKIEGAYEGEHMDVQAFQVRTIQGLGGGLLVRAVHPLGLPVRPWMVRLGQLVHDAVFIAHTAKDVHAQKGMYGLVTVLGQVCKSHLVIGQNGANPEGKGFDHTA